MCLLHPVSCKYRLKRHAKRAVNLADLFGRLRGVAGMSGMMRGCRSVTYLGSVVGVLVGVPLLSQLVVRLFQLLFICSPCNAKYAVIISPHPLVVGCVPAAALEGV